MKTALNLGELARELERQSVAKTDFLVPEKEITMDPFRNTLGFFDGSDNKSLPVLANAHSQIAAHTGIPKTYYDRLLSDSPAMLAGNVNHWFKHDNADGRVRMLRELDGNVRAFLSDRYFRLDNDVIFRTVADALMASADDGTPVQSVSSNVTENHLYMKVVFPRVEGEVKRGDVVQAGIVVKNSEIGRGQFEVQPLIYRLVCTNGMVVPGNGEGGMKRRHTGSRVNAENIVYSAETIEKVAAATLSECRDAIRTFSSQQYLDGVLDRLRGATEGPRVARPVEGVRILGKAIGLTETETDSVLERFIRDQDYSRYGALNAVTNLANTTESYDRASELETLGGRVLDLSASQWREIAEAA